MHKNSQNGKMLRSSGAEKIYEVLLRFGTMVGIFAIFSMYLYLIQLGYDEAVAAI